MNRSIVAAILCGLSLAVPTLAGERLEITVTSSRDGADQNCALILPDKWEERDGPVPLLVSLHTWSGDWTQRNAALEKAAEAEGWIYLSPDFRGPNQHPTACGSELAQQDILDAVDWCCRNYPIDPARIYLAGTSGGGHMAMLMAGRFPDRWTAVSAWVGISDLRAWHDLHVQRQSRYAEMIAKSCGGKPGDSEEVDRQYEQRSPVTFLAGAKDLPLDLAAGIHDGHRGSVPIRQTLDAFNIIARAAGTPAIDDRDIRELSQENGRLSQPLASDQESDESFDRDIHLRRFAGPVRVTIFEGGHEGLASATIAWLRQHRRDDP